MTVASVPTTRQQLPLKKQGTKDEIERERVLVKILHTRTGTIFIWLHCISFSACHLSLSLSRIRPPPLLSEYLWSRAYMHIFAPVWRGSGLSKTVTATSPITLRLGLQEMDNPLFELLRNLVTLIPAELKAAERHKTTTATATALS